MQFKGEMATPPELFAARFGLAPLEGRRNRMRSLKFGTLLLCGSLVLFAGCGSGGVGSGDQQDVYPVTGKVTMNGAPVAGATVTFSPQGKQPVAYGRTNSSGEYALTTYEANDGAAAGDYTVMVSKTVSAPSAVSEESVHQAMSSGEAAPPGSHGGGGGGGGGDDDGSGSLLPEKYSQSGSGLTATVTTDESKNKFDFDLKP